MCQRRWLIWKPKLYILLYTNSPCSQGSIRIPLTHGYGCRKRRLIHFGWNFLFLLNLNFQTCPIVVWGIFIDYKSLKMSADHILLQFNELRFSFFVSNQFENIPSYRAQNLFYIHFGKITDIFLLKQISSNKNQ